MVRKVTPAQYNAMVRQLNNQRNQQIRKINQEIDRVNRANKQAVEKYNRDARQHNQAVERQVRQHNQNAQRAVTQYNQAVRSHNAKVRADRQRLQREITALRARPVVVTYEPVRTSTYRLNDWYERVEREEPVSEAHADLIALSEREGLNSVSVVETLLADEPSESQDQDEDTGILDYLSGFSEELYNRWKGAVYALNPANPDAARHFCTSAREIFTEILNGWAVDADVITADPNCQLTQQNTPTRRAKISYLLKKKGIASLDLIGFVEADIDNIIELFSVFNEATHGAAGKHGLTKLWAIRKRVEGGIMFLAAVAS